MVLEVTPCSLDQLDSATGTLLASYMFRDIEALVPVSDISGGLCIQVRLSINLKAYEQFISICSAAVNIFNLFEFHY